MAAAKSSSSRCDVLTIGSDLAAFIAAVDCARIGLKVDLWIPQDADFSQPAIFSHRGGIVAKVLDDLEVDYEIVIPARGEEEICGIPANPFSPAVRKAVGWSGAWRIYLDRIKPVLTIGNETNLGTLVSQRLGETALSKLVNPVTIERYGYPAQELTVDSVAPGLAQALTRGGSLSNAVVELMLADHRIVERVVVPGGQQAILDAVLAKMEYFAEKVTRVADPTKKLSTAYKKAGVILADFSDVTIPDGVDPHRIAEVGISSQLPGLESAIPASQHAALGMRRVLLSDPEKPPIGTLSFEG
ncbi:MAG: hypothetical protein RLY59_1283 [Actinomycetota bacterium]